MKSVEIPVTAHPTELSIISGIEPEKDFSHKGGRYFFTFRSGNKAHKSFLKNLIRDNNVDFAVLNEQADQALAELGPEYADSGVRKIRADLCEQSARIPKLQEAVNRLEGELGDLQGQIEGNDDPGRVSLLVKAKRERRDQLEEAQASLVAYQNKVGSLSRQANEKTDAIRHKRHLELRAIGDKAATILNNKIRDAVSEYHTTMKPVFPELSESAPFGQTFYGGVYYPHLDLLEPEAKALKSLKAVPQVVIRQNRYEFGLRSLEPLEVEE